MQLAAGICSGCFLFPRAMGKVFVDGLKSHPAKRDDSILKKKGDVESETTKIRTVRTQWELKHWVNERLIF